MDTAMITHSISNILQLMKSPIPLSGIDIDQLQNTFQTINQRVLRMQRHSDSDNLLWLQNINDMLVQQQIHFPNDNLFWLQNLKDVVINLNDLMEDFCHKESRSKSKATSSIKKATDELKHLLNIQETMVIADIDDRNKRREFSHHEFEKITMFGRENEKNEIINLLLNLNNINSSAIVVIVGAPRIGKTKLARLVYEDEQIKSHFGFQLIWIETFDVDSISEVVRTTTHGEPVLHVIDNLRIQAENDDLDKLMKKLTEAVGGIDGVILVTTRSSYVANNIGATHVLKLQGLSQDESFSLLQHIREIEKEYFWIEPESEKNIVRDCGGLPLLIGIIAAEMENYSDGGGDDRIYEVIKMLKLFYYDDLPIYQKLCFVYCSLFPKDYLIDAEGLIQLWTIEGFLTIPGQQFGRACFDDFVSLVFYPLEEENGDVVKNCLYRINPFMHKLAWLIAIGTGENCSVNSIGDRVHGGTLRVSFDFALYLSCGIPDSVFFRSKKLRTILLSYTAYNPRLPHEIRITTSTCDKIFNTFKNSLRALDLHDLGIEMVPRSIGELKLLKYLDLSHNNIKKLPSCITHLIHLHTLKLSQCYALKELPKDIEKLCCLNHLDTKGCLDLTHMPSGIKKLTSLQTLSLFVASNKHVTGGLMSLLDLKNLRGHLEISHLEQVKFSPFNEAYIDKILSNKQDLEFLTLRWNYEEEEEEIIDDRDTKLLECIEPHWNLRVLFVVGYNGQKLPNWFLSLQYLVKFTLNDCPKCQFLPPIDHLPHLKVIQLQRLDSLEFIAKNHEIGNFSISFFQSLKELTISDCPNLKSWWENEINWNDRPSFSFISKLNVQYCPKLARIPLYPNLDEELVLVESSMISMRDTMLFGYNTENTESSNSQSPPFSKLKSMVFERIKHTPPEMWLKNFISLEELHIRDCFNLKSLPRGFKSLSSLQTLSIERCEQLELVDKSCEQYDFLDGDMSIWDGLKNLRSLTLRYIPKLTSLPWGVENVETLQELRFFDCHGLTSLPESIGNLTSLEKLVISGCRNLGSLPKGMEDIESLHTLIIVDCPLLLLRCQPDTGDDWPQISHITNILIKKTSQD